MSEELKRCSYCGTIPDTWTLHGISETLYFCPNSECPNSVRTVTLDQWQKRPIEDALNARIIELENLVEVQRDDNCHLADMCRERDDRIAKLEIALAEALPYEISEKIRKGEGTYIPMPESSEEREE